MEHLYTIRGLVQLGSIPTSFYLHCRENAHGAISQNPLPIWFLFSFLQMRDSTDNGREMGRSHYYLRDIGDRWLGLSVPNTLLLSVHWSQDALVLCVVGSMKVPSLEHLDLCFTSDGHHRVPSQAL